MWQESLLTGRTSGDNGVGSAMPGWTGNFWVGKSGKDRLLCVTVDTSGSGAGGKTSGAFIGIAGVSNDCVFGLAGRDASGTTFPCSSLDVVDPGTSPKKVSTRCIFSKPSLSLALSSSAGRFFLVTLA